MQKTAALSILTLLLLIAGLTGAVSAAEISVQIPASPLTVGETAKIPVTITGADRLTGLTLQIGSSSAATFDQTEQPLGGMYTYNPDNGKLIWISTTPVTGDYTITNLIVTPKSKENVPVEIKLIEASIRPNGPAESDDITSAVKITQNIIIPVDGATTTATIAPTKTASPTTTSGGQGGSQGTAQPTTVKTTVPVTGKTTAPVPSSNTAPAATTVATGGSTATIAPTLTQASTGLLPVIGLLGLLGAVILLRREQ